jgi:hypothetical protein
LDNGEINYDIVIPKFIEIKAQFPQLEIKKFCEDEKIEWNNFKAYLFRHPDIMDQVIARVRRNYHIESLDIDQALIGKSKKGDPRAIELYYKRLEGWNPQGNQHHSHITINLNPVMLKKGENSRVIEIQAGRFEDEIDTSE